jgi:hypothetical protein
MTPELKLARMRKGRERALARKRREAQQRVTRYRRWLLAGSDFDTMPEIPTNADYEAARRLGLDALAKALGPVRDGVRL